MAIGLRLRYFFREELSDFFEPSDFEPSAFELSALPVPSAFDESSDFDLASLLAAESPFDADDAEPVDDFLA